MAKYDNIDIGEVFRGYNVPLQPAGFWNTFTSSIQVPFIDPQLLATEQFFADPNKNTAEALYNSTGFFGDTEGYAKYSWDEVTKNPKLFWDWFKQLAGGTTGQQFSPILSAVAMKSPSAYGFVSTSQYFVNNAKRIAGEYLKAVDNGEQPILPDDQLTKAGSASVMQAGLDMFGLKFLGLSKLMGIQGSDVANDTAKAIIKKADDLTKKTSLTKSLIKGTGKVTLGTAGLISKGAFRGGFEVPQEVAQTVLERWQAGLPLTGDEASEEYMESAVGGFVLGTSLGTGVTVMEKFNRNSRNDPELMKNEGFPDLLGTLGRPQKQETESEKLLKQEDPILKDASIIVNDVASQHEFSGKLPGESILVETEGEFKPPLEGEVVSIVDENVYETAKNDETYDDVKEVKKEIEKETKKPKTKRGATSEGDFGGPPMSIDKLGEVDIEFDETKNSEFFNELNIEKPTSDLDLDKLDEITNKRESDATEVDNRIQSVISSDIKEVEKKDKETLKNSQERHARFAGLISGITDDFAKQMGELATEPRADADEFIARKNTGIDRQKIRDNYIKNPELDESKLGSEVEDLVLKLDEIETNINNLEVELQNTYNKELKKSPKLNIMAQLLKGLPRIIPKIIKTKVPDAKGRPTIQFKVEGTQPIPSGQIGLPKEIDSIFSPANRAKAVSESKLGRPQLLNLQTQINDYIQSWQLLKDITDLLRDNPQKIGTGKTEPKESVYLPTAYFRGDKDSNIYRPLTGDATTAVQSNSLGEALDLIGKENPELRKIAEKLKKYTASTGIRYAKVVDTFGKRRAGMYDTKDNVITIDPEYGGSPHTILHEATHAATHAVLQKGSKHFLVKQIQEIFEESKQFIDPSMYKGAFRFDQDGKPVYDLDEFVAEFFSNPDLQQLLSEYRYKNSKQTLIDRMINFIRRLFNYPPLPEKGVERLNDLIGQILQVSETSPVKKSLFSAAIKDGHEGIMDMTFNKTDKVIKGGMPLTQKNVSIFNRLMRLPGFKQLRYFQPLTYVIESVKANTPAKVSQKFEEMYDLIRRKSGYLQTERERAAVVVKYLENLKDKDPQKFEAFSELAIRTTEHQVIVANENGDPLDPSKPKDAALIEKDKNIKIKNNLYNEETTRILREAYKKLPPPYRKAYAALVKEYKSRFEEHINTMQNDIVNMKDINPETKGFLMAIIKRGIDNSPAPTPFLPLKRFGDFKVSLLEKDNTPNPADGKGYSRKVEHFETEAQRNLFIAKYQEGVLNKTSNKDRQIILQLNELYKEFGSRGIAVSPIKDLNAAQLSNLSADQRQAYFALKNIFNQLSVDGKFKYSLFNSPTSFKNYVDLAKNPETRNTLSAPILKQLEKVLDEGQVSPEAKEEFFNYAFSNLPDYLFGNLLRKRSNPVVLGASTDIINGYRTSVQSMISRQANALFNAPMDKLMNSIRETIRRDAETGEGVNYATGNVEQAQEYADMLEKTVSFAKSPESSRLADAITATGFHWFLGFNISSALIQGTNMVGVIFPALGGKFGFGNAAGAIRKASGILKNAGLTRTIKDPTGLLGDDKVIDSVSILNYSKEQLSTISKSRGYDEDTLVKLRSALKDFGQLGRSSEQDLLDPSREGKKGSFIKGKPKRYMDTLLKSSSFLFNLTEQAQREVTALAAFDLAYTRNLKAVKEGRMTKQEAYKLAEKEAVNSIELYNGGISRETSPAFSRLDRGGWLRVVALFKNYGFFLYSLIFSLLKKSLPRYLGNNYSKEDVAAARKTLIGVTGAAYLMGGAKGVPFFFVPEMIYNSFFRDEGEEEFDQLVSNNVFGESALDRLFDIKVSSRTGFYQVIFQSPRVENDTMGGFLDSWALNLLGASYSGARNFALGTNDIAKGDFRRGIEKMVPTSVANLSKGIRYYTDGVVTRRGDTVLEPLGLFSAISNGVGIKTRTVFLSTDVPFNVRKRFEEVDKKKQGFLEKLEHHSKTGDVEAFRDVYSKLKEFGQQTITDSKGNKLKIKDVFNINAASVAKSMKIRLSKDKPYGMYINPRYKDLFTALIEQELKKKGVKFSDNMLLST